jgi:hypothetical protein
MLSELYTCIHAHGFTRLLKYGARDDKFWSPTRWLTFGNVAELAQSHAERTMCGAIEHLFFLTGLIPQLLPTHRVSCVDRINSGIPPIDNKQ